MCAVLYMNSDVLLLLSGFTHAIRYVRNWVEPIKLQSFMCLLCHIHVDSRLTVMCLSMLCPTIPTYRQIKGIIMRGWG